jgi:hypothetical protein
MTTGIPASMKAGFQEFQPASRMRFRKESPKER